MANTTNYNWETPDDTDLVKDGAAAIRTLGSSIDTTTKNLNPETTLGDIAYRSATANTNTRLAIGTTGQVLTVAGGVPTWATSDDANAIQNAIVDAKGDLISATAADTPARLAVGANGTVLTADSAEATGLKWATPAGGGGKVLQVVQGTITSDVSTSSASYTDSGLTVSITPSSSASKVLVLASMPSAYIYQTGSGTTLRGGYALLRGATQLTESKFGWSAMSFSADNIFTSTQSVAYLDSPATTSSTTYKIQYKKIAGTVVGLEGSATSIQSIVVLEIGA